MPDRPLNTVEEQSLLERVADLSRSGMPLSEGLRVAAGESVSPRLARQLHRLADQLDSGTSWEQVFSSQNTVVRPHILGVLRAGVQSGDVSEALDALIDQERAYRDLRRELMATLAYPTILCLLGLGLVCATLLFIVPYFDAIFSDFGTELPQVTQIWIKVSRQLPEVLYVSLASVAVGLVAIRFIGGQAVWLRCLASIPIVGTMLHDAGVAQLLRLMEVLLRKRMPLPEALRLASTGVADKFVQQTAVWLAQGTEAGRSLSQMIESTGRLPAVIAPVLHWGEIHDSLPVAVRDAYNMLENRIHVRRSVLDLLVGPLMLIVLGILLGSIILAVTLPLVSLIQNLT